jgi:hypothetical protein
LLVKCIIHGNQTTGKNATVKRKQLRKSVTTTKSGFVKCRANVSCDGLISTPSSAIAVFLSDVSVHTKRQLRKSIALPSINIDKEAQINANVDSETQFFSIKIYILFSK